ncbi:MAG: hypothetical protein ALECFALPRED_009391 [Alectoria fallacina]|uniref:SET domain-containing protein n=1 Tax=Alectoria fallacina TaxID=1903189 RepID=A0A8H3EFK3_9LECA|nr:MAG: hypothetical protein ALECFALPRED_009391 [Alectoria fallacina]
MTDPSLNTHTATSVQATAGYVPSVPAPPQDPIHAPGDEVEDYIIKCICGFREDDGNTVYCDLCDTWQHTECYYYDKHGNVPTKEELEVIDHFCADCQPRSLNAKGAIERQRIRRKELDPGDRKVKKSTAKSHKKKIRGPESNGLLINGWDHSDQDLFNDGASQSPRDQHPPAKRPKTNHRPSHSMQFPILSQNLNSHTHKASGSTVHSPSKVHGKHSPIEYTREPYSDEFLSLYDNDPGDTPMQTNLLNNISITRDLSHWSRDVELLREATNGLTPQDVFNRCEQSLDSMSLPDLNKEYREEKGAVPGGRRPRWTYLTIDSFRPKGSIVGEIRGKIGHMQHYIQDPNNRWEYLRHPAPFVFFHPKLPIYIDTRSEGTICRYLRRSCDPNLSMKTFLENGSDYHFCFVAKKDLDAGTELTIGWVLDEHIRSFFYHRNQEEVKIEGDVNAEEDYVTDWAAKVLGEFGGCACDSSKCAFDRYDQRSTNIVKGRDGHNDKQLQGNNDYGTNSRASSDQDDGRSSSGSQSQSRDITPTRNASGDMGFGVEISDREKRKIAALEKNFEQLENEKYQPGNKKKKRNSGGSNVNTPSAGTSKQLGHTATSFSQPNTPGLSLKPQYADASTSGRKSGSPTTKSSNASARPRTGATTNAKKRSYQPNTPSIPSPLIRPNYVSTAMQTDRDDEDDWYQPPGSPFLAKKPYMSLTKRLLLRSQRDRVKLEERKRASLKNPSCLEADGALGKVAPSQMHEDTETQHPGSGQSSLSAHASIDSILHSHSNTAELKPPLPWPSNGLQEAVEQPWPIKGFRTNDLRVQLPSKPSVPTDFAPNTPLIETPTSSVPQPPFAQNSASHPSLLSSSSSNLVQPSPIKKKVSLGEYFSRRKGSQPATEMPASSSPTMQHGTLKHLGSMNGEPKNGAMHGSAIVETPKEEHDPLVTGES